MQWILFAVGGACATWCRSTKDINANEGICLSDSSNPKPTLQTWPPWHGVVKMESYEFDLFFHRFFHDDHLTYGMFGQYLIIMMVKIIDISLARCITDSPNKTNIFPLSAPRTHPSRRCRQPCRVNTTCRTQCRRGMHHASTLILGTSAGSNSLL